MYEIVLLVTGAILGALLGGIVTVVLSRPKVSLSVSAPVHLTHNRFGPFISLRVQVSNVARGWTLLSPAIRCRGTITFYNRDGHNIFGRPMVARWANLPQPLPIMVAMNGQALQVFDIESFNRESRMDIYPGESEPLDIAVRLGDDTDCYAWNNDGYVHPDGARNPNWKLRPGVYLGDVTLNVSGQPQTFHFRVHNDGPPSSFRLEVATEVERRKIEAAKS
jgi:hypothetical protein